MHNGNKQTLFRYEIIDGQRRLLSRVGYNYLIPNVRERDNCFINNSSKKR